MGVLFVGLVHGVLELDCGGDADGDAEERGADLIIVGSRGTTGTSRFLLGSVPNKISHHAPCAVLIIRTP